MLEVRERTPCLSHVIIFDMEGLRHLDDDMCISLEDLMRLGDEHEQAHPGAWEHALRRAEPEDLMVLTYTSGTTGPPKGAMISQRNMMFMMVSLQKVFNVYPEDQQLGFLPLAHVAGRMFYTFAVIEAVSVVNLIEDPETMLQDAMEVAPTIHFAVPRVWEKQYSTVTIKLKEGTRLGRLAYQVALNIGEKASKFERDGEKLPLGLRVQRFLADQLVFKNIRRLLGINEARWLSTAAAPIAPELIGW